MGLSRCSWVSNSHRFGAQCSTAPWPLEPSQQPAQVASSGALWASGHCRALLTLQDSFLSRSPGKGQLHITAGLSSASGHFRWRGLCPVPFSADPGLSRGRCPSPCPQGDPNAELAPGCGRRGGLSSAAGLAQCSSPARRVPTIPSLPILPCLPGFSQRSADRLGCALEEVRPHPTRSSRSSAPIPRVPGPGGGSGSGHRSPAVS